MFIGFKSHNSLYYLAFCLLLVIDFYGPFIIFFSDGEAPAFQALMSSVFSGYSSVLEGPYI